jgi:hypothetical protein
VSSAYVDTSCLVAIAFAERAAGRLANRLRTFERLLSSNLLEAELRSALAREGVRDDAGPLLSGMTWVHPDRPLPPEFDRVLAAGYLKGADLWHLATAVFLAPAGHDLAFLSLERRQREVAARLGFTV